jgi:hypothetical protein
LNHGIQGLFVGYGILDPGILVIHLLPITHMLVVSPNPEIRGAVDLGVCNALDLA